jgi:hypothetical protein
MNEESEMQSAAREFWSRVNVVLQPPGWGKFDYSDRCVFVCGALEPRLALTLDEPILDALVSALDELPENEGTTAVLERHGSGAWFFELPGAISFHEPSYESYRDMVRVSDYATIERGAVAEKPILNEHIERLLRAMLPRP